MYKPKPKKVEDENLKPVLPSRSLFAQQLYQSIEEFEFHQYVSKCLEDAQSHHLLSNASNRGESAADMLTFAGDAGGRDSKDHGRVDCDRAHIEVPNIQKGNKGHVSPFRGRDPSEINLKASQSMMVEETDTSDQHHPQKDIPLLRAMSEKNENSITHLEFSNSPLLKQDMNGGNRPGFKLVQQGNRTHNGLPQNQTGGPLFIPDSLPRHGGMSGVGSVMDHRSPRQFVLQMGISGTQPQSHYFMSSPGIPLMTLEPVRHSLHNSNSKSRVVAIVPQEEKFTSNGSTTNP